MGGEGGGGGGEGCTRIVGAADSDQILISKRSLHICRNSLRDSEEQEQGNE